MLAHFSLLSAAWAHFSHLAAFVVPFACFFRDLGRSSLDFGAPSWPYLAHFSLLAAFFDMLQGLLQTNPAGIAFLLFVSTMQRGATCAAHGIEAKFAILTPQNSPTKLLNRDMLSTLKLKAFQK